MKTAYEENDVEAKRCVLKSYEPVSLFRLVMQDSWSLFSYSSLQDSFLSPSNSVRKKARIAIGFTDANVSMTPDIIDKRVSWTTARALFKCVHNCAFY